MPTRTPAAVLRAAGLIASVGLALTGAVSAGPPERAGTPAAAPLTGLASHDHRTALLGAKAPVQVPNTYFGSQWDLWDADSSARAGGYGVDAPRAWTRTVGSPRVVVAVLDSGITPHPYLRGASFAPGYDFVSGGDGVDPRDGGGWDTDPGDPGDACPATDDPSTWHGTFVAGEIAAQRGANGVVGESPGVTIEPVRVLGSCGGSESDTVAAIEWASGGDVPGVPVNTRPAAVITLSLGSSDATCSAALQTAIDDATSRGAVVVAAAGNASAPVADVSPANCAGVVSVAASTRSGALAGYSDRGTDALSPTIAAPGGSDGDPVLGAGWTSTGAFTARGDRAVVTAAEGTSMAAPRVAAAIALLLSVRPGLTPAQVRARLVATATPFPASAGCTAVRCGPGIVNAGDLVGAPARFVQVGAATLRGRGRVGGVLTATAGSWRVMPGVVRYRWTRDGRTVVGATGASYPLRAADAGHSIAVRVQVGRAGYAPAGAWTAARRVRP